MRLREENFHGKHLTQGEASQCGETSWERSYLESYIEWNDIRVGKIELNARKFMTVMRRYQADLRRPLTTSRPWCAGTNLYRAS